MVGKLETSQQPGLTLFAVGMVALGALALRYGDFALVWQPVAPWVPGRVVLAYCSGVLMVVCGAGLLFRPAAKWAVRVLFPYLIVWALLKVPALVVAPQMEAVWLGIGELTVLLAGGWVLFARLGEIREDSLFGFLAGERGVFAARILMGVSLIPIGLSHLVYSNITASMVPAWLPYRLGWAYLTGAGQIACGLGLLFGILPGVAAMVEAAMVFIFAFLVWGPGIAGAPKQRLPWTAFFISWAIAAAAWVVAQNVGARKRAGA